MGDRNISTNKRQVEDLEEGVSWEDPWGSRLVIERAKRLRVKSCDYGRVTTLTQFVQDFPGVSLESLIP